MLNCAAHAAGGVVLGEPIRRQDVRKARIVGLRGIGVIGALLRFGRRIGRVLWIQRILNRRFQRLVVRGQRAILQSAGDEDPADAVGMQDERLVAGESVDAFSIPQIAL